LESFHVANLKILVIELDLTVGNTQRMFNVISRKVFVTHVRPPIRKIVSVLRVSYSPHF